jgi:hypothetical protein
MIVFPGWGRMDATPMNPMMPVDRPSVSWCFLSSPWAARHPIRPPAECPMRTTSFPDSSSLSIMLRVCVISSAPYNLQCQSSFTCAFRRAKLINHLIRVSECLRVIKPRQGKKFSFNHQFLPHIILYSPDTGSCMLFRKLNMFFKLCCSITISSYTLFGVVS